MDPWRDARGRHRRLTVMFSVVGGTLPVLVFLGQRLGETSGHAPVLVVGAAMAAVAPVGVSLVPRSAARWRWPFTYGGLVGLTLMQAWSGGVGSPAALLLAMPMIWFGVRATGTELSVGLMVVLGCCFVPMVVVGAPAYPVDLFQGLLLALVTCSVALSLAMACRESRRLTARLRMDAVRDPLTGLLNRRGWDEAAERLAGPTDRAVLVLTDLDRLKAVNDEQGHAAGDRTLRDSAARLRAAFTPGTVARLGGDEFAVLLLGVEPVEVMSRLTALRLATPEPEGFSAGVAVLDPGEQIGDGLRRADLALYEAKASGRGRSCLAPAPQLRGVSHIA